MSKKYKGPRPNVDRIIADLIEVQRHFPEINKKLRVRREDLLDDMIQNMAVAYHYLDYLLVNQVDLFSDPGLEHLLELNHIVLCGRDMKRRMEFGRHIQETRRKFSVLVKPIAKWYKKHKDWSPVKLAAMVYVGILSKPQLYIEGNHRTGALTASYILMQGGRPPFVLNVGNALAYFNPSSEIKMSNKRSMKGRIVLPAYEKSFKRFLEEHISADYVIGKVKT